MEKLLEANIHQKLWYGLVRNICGSGRNASPRLIWVTRKLPAMGTKKKNPRTQNDDNIVTIFTTCLFTRLVTRKSMSKTT